MAIEYLSFKEAMKYLGMKYPITLRAYIAEGLPVIEVGKSKKISKTDIDVFMKEHRKTAQHETSI
jgi:excisionase family DNA binding protein